MKKILLFLIVTMTALSAWESAKVVLPPFKSSMDGDTLWLKKKGEYFKVRLIGLDTFETKVNHMAFRQLEMMKDIHPKHLSNVKPTIKLVLYYGHKAKEFTASHVLGKYIEYHSYGKDKYDRELIYVKNLNYLLIRNGLAVQYPTNKLSKERKAFLLQASREANLEQRGFYDRGKK